MEQTAAFGDRAQKPFTGRERIRRFKRHHLAVLMLPIIVTACVSTKMPATSTPLFDGMSLAGWVMLNGSLPDPRAWQAKDGLILQVSRERSLGDLMTLRCYTNFDLSLEWRLEKGGNSGILYRVAPTPGVPAWHSGIEYSLLDDANYPAATGKPKQHSGAAFDLYPPTTSVLRTTGEYNQARIKLYHGRVTHWLNGAEVANFEIGSADWRRALAVSKFADIPVFAKTNCGRIVLQNHGDPVQFRALQITDLGL